MACTVVTIVDITVRYALQIPMSDDGRGDVFAVVCMRRLYLGRMREESAEGSVFEADLGEIERGFGKVLEMPVVQ